MKKLWTDTGTKLNKLIENYCFAEGVELDNYLTKYDVYASIAHASMLCKIGIIDKNEFDQLKKLLLGILKLGNKDQFIIKIEDEDVHTKIESYLSDKLGDLGKKIHTGRSRNDQVLVDLRLYTKEQLFSIADLLIETAGQFLLYAKKYEFIPMPGYTHMQKAMPSSVGMWLGSFAEQIIDILDLLKASFELNDQSPLGSGAAYGVSLPIDREMTAKLLGFKKVQSNSLYSQISRPTFHLALMHNLGQIMLAMSRFANDLLLFTTSEFDFFDVDENICTGSSIMPQKKNLDLLEYVRAKSNKVLSASMTVGVMTAALPSGYNGDFGETKGPFIESINTVKDTLKMLPVILSSIKPKTEILEKACSKEIYATHFAYEKVKKGTPFRSAYLETKKQLDQIPLPDIKKFLTISNHTGGTGNLLLKESKKYLYSKQNFWNNAKKQYREVINSLLS